MRELNVSETEVVNGGAVFAVLGFVASAAGHFMARSAASYVVSRVGLVAGTVGLLESLSGSQDQ